MRTFVVVALVVFNLGYIKAGWNTNCHVEGVDDFDWWMSFQAKTTINDDVEGLIAIFETANIVALAGQSSPYLSATYEDGFLKVYTNERFKKFEEEYIEHRSSEISLKMDFNCTDGKSETLDMRQEVKDVNNHDPILSRNIYEYDFSTIIPENYDLTRLLPISASDIDFTNRRVYFTVSINEYFVLTYETEEDRDNRTNYFTTLKSLKPIVAPFKQEFTITARDGGDPARNTTALLIVSVNETKINDGDEDVPHPPVFGKHLYFADYTSDNDLEMGELISIKYGAEADTAVVQSGFEEYFKVQLDNPSSGILRVTKVKSLPKSVIEKEKLIVIEIEAINQGLQIPGRTALIIRLPAFRQDNSAKDPENGSGNCENVTKYIYGNSTTELTITLSVLFVIVFVNLVTVVWFCRRRNFV